MPRKLILEGLQADKSAVNALLQEAIAVGDRVGKAQLSKRKQALEEEISKIAAASEKTASLALFFGGAPVLGSRGISADFASTVLGEFQDLISKTFSKSEFGTLDERGPIPLKDSSKLMVTEIARGSFGFVLDEISDQMQLTDTALKSTVEEVTTLLQRTTSPNELDFEDVSETLDARTLIALRDLFITLDSNSATLRIVEDVADLTLDEPAIHRGRQRTEATKIDETNVDVIGELIGFLPDHRKFEAKQEDGRIMYGSASKEAADQYVTLLAAGETVIGKRWNLKINRRIVNALNRPPRVINRLLKFIEPDTYMDKKRTVATNPVVPA